MPAKRKGYFQVDNNIFDNNTLALSLHEKMVYIYLSRCGNQGAMAFPSYNTIAKKCGMCKRSALNAVKGLEQREFIKVERCKESANKNLSNTYEVFPLPAAINRSMGKTRSLREPEPILF